MKLNLFRHGLQAVLLFTQIMQIKFLYFKITETNLYVPVVTLSTEDNAKLLPQLESVQ